MICKPRLVYAPVLALHLGVAGQAAAAAPRLLPSPDLSHVLIVSGCDTNLRMLTVKDGTTTALPGSVRGVSWIDDQQYALLAAEQGKLALVIAGGPGKPQQVVLSEPLPSGDGRPCDPLMGLSAQAVPGVSTKEAFRLLRITDRGGALYVHRYLLTQSQGRWEVALRTEERIGEPPFSGYRLTQIVPDSESTGMLLIWRSLRRKVPAVQLTWSGRIPGPVRSPEQSALLGDAGERLSSCQVGRRYVVCRTGAEEDDKGWLFSIDLSSPRPAAPRQQSREGSAAAFALSPEGRQVAYVGSGMPDDPLWVQDLQTGGRRQIVLREGGECEAATAQVFWLGDGRLLARGSCGGSLTMLSTQGDRGELPQPAAVSEAPPPRPEPPRHAATRHEPSVPREPSAPREPAAPREPSARRDQPDEPARGRRPKRTQRRDSAYWTPRY